MLNGWTKLLQVDYLIDLHNALLKTYKKTGEYAERLKLATAADSGKMLMNFDL